MKIAGERHDGIPVGRRALEGQGEALLAALQFLTILPLGRPRMAAGLLPRAAALFPLAGALVGAAMGAALLLVDYLGATAGGVAAVAIGAVMTRFLHLDGLADAADGLLGGATPARRREIMKDPAIGAFGVVAIVLCLMLKATLIARLPAADMLLSLVFVGGFSRLSMTALAWLGRPAAETGLGAVLAERVRMGAVVIPMAVLLALMAKSYGAETAVGAGAATLLVAGLVARAGRRMIGGITGDLFGATSELAELALLLVMVLSAGGTR